MEPGNYVVVTTKHRGVFAGRLVNRENSEVKLKDARVCIYWSTNTKGFVGLAVTGPIKGSRVSPAAPEMVIADVTSITLCSEQAEKQWENGPWE